MASSHENSSSRIGGLTHWKNHDADQKALDRLLHDLRVETS